jgi:hypothetical protein
MTYKEIQMVLNAKAREVYYEHFWVFALCRPSYDQAADCRNTMHP